MLITLCLFFHSNASNVHVVRASNHTSRVRQSVRPSVRPTPDALSLLALADDFHPAAAVQRRPLQAPHSSSIEPRCCDQTVAPRVVPGLPISSHTGACPLIICVSTFGPDNWRTAGEARGGSRVSLVVEGAKSQSLDSDRFVALRNYLGTLRLARLVVGQHAGPHVHVEHLLPRAPPPWSFRARLRRAWRPRAQRRRRGSHLLQLQWTRWHGRNSIVRGAYVDDHQAAAVQRRQFYRFMNPAACGGRPLPEDYGRDGSARFVHCTAATHARLEVGSSTIVRVDEHLLLPSSQQLTPSAQALTELTCAIRHTGRHQQSRPDRTSTVIVLTVVTHGTTVPRLRD